MTVMSVPNVYAETGIAPEAETYESTVEETAQDAEESTEVVSEADEAEEISVASEVDMPEEEEKTEVAEVAEPETKTESADTDQSEIVALEEDQQLEGVRTFDVNSVKYKDGTYTPTDFAFAGGSGKTTISCPKVEVKEGIPYATIVFSSTKYTKLVVNDTEYTPVTGTEYTGSVFNVPMLLNQAVIIKGTTIAMTEAHDIEYSINISCDAEIVKDVTWQDGTYIGTGTVTPVASSNFDQAYDVDVTLTVTDGKVSDVKYTKSINPQDSNMSYRKWAMEGVYVYHSKDDMTHEKGVGEQIIENNSADEIDTVTRATRTSLGIQEAAKAALKKAETGDTSTDVTPDEPQEPAKIADDGVYAVDTTAGGVTVIDAELRSENGEMKALVTLSGTAYDYLYFGDVSEAIKVGEENWVKQIGTKQYVAADGRVKTGGQYLIPVESLDRVMAFVVHSTYSGSFFYRTIKFDSASLQKKDRASMVNGTYMATAHVEHGPSSYPKQPYDIGIVVKIQDNKIASIKYDRDLTLDDGNYSYLKFVLDGEYVYETATGKTTYYKGFNEQLVGKSTAEDVDNVDNVTGATRTVIGAQEAIKEILKKAEIGDTYTEPAPTPDKPVGETKVAGNGTYLADTTINGITVIDSELTSKDGKMSVLVTLSGTGFDYFYMGDAHDAVDAGKDTWYGVVGKKQYVNASGVTKTGAQFILPIESLDRDIILASHASGSGKWFYRSIRVDSSSLKKYADKTALQAKTVEAKKIVKGTYTTATWNTLQTAIKEAEALLAEDKKLETEVQANIDAKLKALTAAINGLKKNTLSISAGATTIGVGEKTTVKATVSGDSQNVTWTTSNAAVATVAGGVVTAKAAGTVTITATANGIKQSVNVTVVNPNVVIAATKATLYTAGNKTFNLNTKVYGVNKAVTYKTSNKKVATVSKTGVITAKKAGTAKITATVKINGKNKTVTCKVTVKKPTIKLTKSSATLKVGATTTIKVKATPAGKATFKSSNKKVATVDGNGVVTAKKKGTAKITVKCNGVSKTFKVKVKK